LQPIYILYRSVQVLAFPLIVLYLVWRALRDRRYWRGLRERLGFLPARFRQRAPQAVWIHAVSVGEVLSVVELLRRLRAECPLAPLFVSTTTLAGRAAAEQRLAGLADGVFYAPIDYCFAVRRVLRALRPRVVVVMETEIWPNLYREARRTECGLVVVNGRISERAWPRYRALKWFFGPVLQWPQAILAQSEVSRWRYRELGAPAEIVSLAGNLKYDFDPRRAHVPLAVKEFLERVRPGEVWIAASTMPPAAADDVDEDEVVVEAFRTLAERHPELLLVLVPRRPERFDTAAEALTRAGVPFLRRSALAPHSELRLPAALLVDSIGELAGLFPLADVVFMGGSLARRGGHNILEPAFAERAIIVGPHLENFPDIAAKFRAAGAVVESTDLAGAVDALLQDSALRSELGRKARQLAEAEQGATARALEEIRGLCRQVAPRYRPAAYRTLWLLSRLWLLGVWLKRRYWLARVKRLRTPVVSVGSLAVGGAGKSPIVLWLAERLRSAGRRPAILTRGYRRQTPQKCTVLEAGARAPAALTGDEAQAYLEVAPLGISSDRYRAGRLIEERLSPDVFLLDDGFQHWRLARALDIVVLDGLDPFGGGEPVPLGRLRETPRALARASVIVVSRAPSDDELEAHIRKYNSAAPIFRARVVPEFWVDRESGQQWAASELPFSPVAAFCGLGNPAAFWQTLAALGHRPLLRREFPDHHRYRPAELRKLALQAAQLNCAALLTTEKDLMNLPEGSPRLVQPLRLCWLKIGVEIDQGEQLLRRMPRS
jgi:tetraacyldisaccharide 4'-kinase